MAKKSSMGVELLGIVLIIVGIGLMLWGNHKSGSFISQLNFNITGSHTDAVMKFYIGGAVSFIAGVLLYLKKK
jgi:hypothetical protein